MLLTPAQIDAVYCKTTGKGKNKVTTCSYPPLQIIDSVLYEGYFGLLLTLLFFLLYMFFFFLNRYIGKDWVKCFTTATAIPLSIGTFFRFWEIILAMCFNVRYFIVEIFSHLYSFSLTAAIVSANLGIGCFIYNHAFIVCTRKIPEMDDTWSTYLSLQLVGWIVSGCFHFASTDYKRLPSFVLTAVLSCGVLLLLISLITSFWAILFCRNRPSQTENPIGRYACIRLLWSFIAMCWIIPSIPAIYFYAQDASNLVDPAGTNMTIAVDLFYKERILEFFTGPILIVTIMLLPTYREAILKLFACGLLQNNQETRRPGRISAFATTPLISSRTQVFPLEQAPAVQASPLNRDEAKSSNGGELNTHQFHPISHENYQKPLPQTTPSISPVFQSTDPVVPAVSSVVPVTSPLPVFPMVPVTSPAVPTMSTAVPSISPVVPLAYPMITGRPVRQIAPSV